MARTPSSMVELGTSAPDFRLSDVVSGKKVSRADVTGPKGILAMFICRHCPFVKHVQDELAKLGRDYARSGVGIVAIWLFIRALVSANRTMAQRTSPPQKPSPALGD